MGKALFSLCVIALAVVGWFVYDATMAPDWMRKFAEELNTRATITGEFRPEAAFPTLKNRPDPDSPYICFSHIADFEWDRLYIVPSGGPIPISITAFDWPDEPVSELSDRLASDPRYQIIAFTLAGRVVDYAYYFTIWGDLSEAASPQGFDRSEAVFVAESDGQSFTLRPALTEGRSHCAA